MAREIGLALFILLGVVLLTLMVVSWRRRVARQAGLGVPGAVPSTTASVIATLGGQYVATTPAGEPLNRIAVKPLGFPANAELTVTDDGLIVALTGSEPFFVPKDDLLGAGRATWTVDRGVETDGLNLVSWRLNGTGLDSYFRLRDPRAFDSAIATIAPSNEGTPA